MKALREPGPPWVQVCWRRTWKKRLVDAAALAAKVRTRVVAEEVEGTADGKVQPTTVPFSRGKPQLVGGVVDTTKGAAGVQPTQ